MAVLPAPPFEHEIEVGEHVSIKQGEYSIPLFLGKTGIVVEVFRIPQGSCLVRLDGDRNLQREWFFYSDEITLIPLA
ncbi:MAG: hypothetical protein JST60_04600 [Chloroflexi bacterium SZAS-1]|jgi:hypothetical protein|nr:hypothetical protein [Chloroflexi bacterium SZAS-1]